MKRKHEQLSVKTWDDAISLAEDRIKQLKDAITGFRAAKDRGDLWPERQVKGHQRESATLS